MNALQLSCPNCSARIPADHIHLNNLMAKCASCDSVFNFSEQVGQPRRFASEKQNVLMPTGFEVLELRSQLDMEINWRKTSGNKTFLFIFTIFWNACLIPFVLVALTSGEWMIMLFLSLHLMVGIGFLYYTLAVLLNTTYVNVTPRHITINHKPLNVIGRPEHNISAGDVEQLYVNKYSTGKTNNRPTYAFGVYAVLNGGRQIALVKGLRHPDQARYIEQEVEHFLNIEDELMEEEWMG